MLFYHTSLPVCIFILVVLMVIPFCVVLKQEREYNRPYTRYGTKQFYRRSMSTIFLQAPKDIFYCEGVVTKGGELVPLTVFDKMVYFHMLDRKRMFVDKGGKHFEGQDTIAEVVQINRKTAIASLKKLRAIDLIQGHKESHPLRGYSHWVYTDVNTSPVVYGDKRKSAPTSASNVDTDSDLDDIQLPF